MSRVVTLNDIAKQAGLSKCTVSYALRDSPRTSLATRRRVRRIADELGYRPNPLASLWMSQVRAPVRGGLRATIGYLINDGSGTGEELRAPHRRLVEGAGRRARELGYGFDLFPWEVRGMTSDRFHDILAARGIHGLILSPLAPGRMDHVPWIRWDRFASAVLGFSLVEPMLHRAANFQGHSMRRICLELFRRDYQRPALVVDSAVNRKFDFAWTAVFRERVLRSGKRFEAESVFEFSESLPMARFRDWLERFAPDVVICEDEAILSAVEASGRAVPGDLGVVFTKLPEPGNGMSGIDQREEEIGAAAVDLVVEQLALNRFGVPESPKTVLIEGRWIAGRTLRAVADREPQTL